MLTEAEALIEHLPIDRLIHLAALHHELLTNHLRFFQANGKILYALSNHIDKLIRQLPNSTFVHLDFARPPVALLRWHIRCRYDRDRGSNQEERQDLAMTWFSWVHELEVSNAMLETVGKRDQSIFAG